MLEQRFIGQLNTDDSDRDLEDSVKDCLNLVPQNNGLGNSLRVENVKGNAEITNGFLPDGTNKTIGQFADKDNQSIVYFNYNSNNNHSIFIYERNEDRVYLALQTSELNWTSDTKITGAGLIKDQLIFTDTVNEIRSFDITKGKNTFDVNEKKKWELLITDSTGLFSLTVVDSLGGSSSAIINPTTLANIASTITAAFADLTATVCGNSVEIEENTAGLVDSVSVNNDFVIAPLNTYVTPISQRSITLINYPYPFSPEVEYGTDSTRTINFLLTDSFQFSVRYIYFDDSQSTISPYSEILTKTGCGVGSSNTDNYVNVQFSASQLSEEELSLIKNVEILFRKGNSGSFYKAATLDRWEFFEGSYRFYNDGAYDVVADQDIAKQFDSIPNKANALAILKNRLFVGGYTEGYETPCVNATADVTVEDAEGGTANTWTITGRIRIVNRFLQPSENGTVIHTNQPIHSVVGDSNRENWVYGGLGGNGSRVAGFYPNPGGAVTQANHVQYGQFIPEGGFTVFLAGTNYYGISEQYTKSYTNPDDTSITKNASTVSESPIVFKTTQQGDTADANNEFDKTATRHVMSNNNVYSTFEIKNVPPGKYILRVASPLCARTENLRSDTDSFYDLNGNISDWQSTSAEVITIDGTPIGLHSNVNTFYPNGTVEKVIELSDSGGVYDLHQGSADRAILIADLTDLDLTANSRVNKGYLVDAETLDEDGFISALRMERQKIHIANNFDNINNAYSFRFQTDHNGYWWFAYSAAFLGIANSVTLTRSLFYNGGYKNSTSFPLLGNLNENNQYEIKHWNQEHYIDTDISDVYNANILSKSKQVDFINSAFTHKYIVYNYNDSVRDYGRTLLEATVTDSDGNGLSGINALLTNTSRFEKTDSNGTFNIVIYADRDDTATQFGRQGTLLLGTGTQACVSFTNISQAFNATPISRNDFNNDNPFILSDIIISDLVSNTASNLKKGGIFRLGIVYYDEALRSSFTYTDDNLKVRIPYYTDDLGVVLPDNYSAGTYKYGAASINWQINSAPPEWARYYQIVRTKDTAFNSFFTWSANDVLYVKEWDAENELPIETTFGSSEANEVYIDASNIATYITSNSNAKIGYTYSDGDRLIIIKNDGEYLEDYVDVEVRGQRGDYIIIENLSSVGELKGGMKFQVYTPKLQNETEIFYEIGEVYNVLNPGTPSRSHEVTSGSIIKGDAYTVGRNIPIDVGSETDIYEHPTVSDKVTERFSDIGRPNTINKNAKSTLFYSSVRFSDPLIENSYDNGISSFFSLNKEDLPLERGEITKMIATTNVVVAIHKTEATSLYIGEGFLHTADGGAVEIKTDKIIGDERMLKGEYGTIHPESVVEFDDVVYWWSQAKGDIIRYSNNGLTPLGLVSKYKNKFLEIQNYQIANIKSSSENSVYGGYNPLWDMALMTFKNINGEDITIGFHERNDAFKTRFSFTQEQYSYIDSKLYSFKDGVLYEHDRDDVDRNTFNGVTYPSQVHIVSSMNNEIEKIYRSIGIKSNEKWAAIRIFNKEGQETDLVLNDFVQRDDMYYADILRNKNTSLDTLGPNQTALLHGEIMRSQLMEFVLENTNTDKTEIDFIVIDFQESPGHLINR